MQLHCLRVIKMINQNLPHAILPERRKNLRNYAITLTGKQTLQQRRHARIGRDVQQMQLGTQAVARIPARETDFTEDIGIKTHQVAA